MGNRCRRKKTTQVGVHVVRRGGGPNSMNSPQYSNDIHRESGIRPCNTIVNKPIHQRQRERLTPQSCFSRRRNGKKWREEHKIKCERGTSEMTHCEVKDSSGQYRKHQDKFFQRFSSADNFYFVLSLRRDQVGGFHLQLQHGNPSSFHL